MEIGMNKRHLSRRLRAQKDQLSFNFIFILTLKRVSAGSSEVLKMQRWIVAEVQTDLQKRQRTRRALRWPIYHKIKCSEELQEKISRAQEYCINVKWVLYFIHFGLQKSLKLGL